VQCPCPCLIASSRIASRLDMMVYWPAHARGIRHLFAVNDADSGNRQKMIVETRVGFFSRVVDWGRERDRIDNARLVQAASLVHIQTLSGQRTTPRLALGCSQPVGGCNCQIPVRDWLELLMVPRHRHHGRPHQIPTNTLKLPRQVHQANGFSKAGFQLRKPQQDGMFVPMFHDDVTPSKSCSEVQYPPSSMLQRSHCEARRGETGQDESVSYSPNGWRRARAMFRRAGRLRVPPLLYG
jgi:hypothetical protein